MNHNHHRTAVVRLAVILLCLGMFKTGHVSADDPREKVDEVDPSGVSNVVSIEVSKLDESSGLAVSLRRKNHFWSHNDSGGKARLFAFNTQGKKTGQVKLKSARAEDWEDMASYLDRSVPRLLVGDCGDNREHRRSIHLYLLDEPDPTESLTLKDYQSIQIRYPDGPHDCEAVAVDLRTRRILLATKSALPMSVIFAIALPDREDQWDGKIVIAQRVTTVPMPMVTAMDIDPANGDIWLASYFQAFRFHAQTGHSLVSQLGALPTPHLMPRWKQIEAIAVDGSGDLWVTSEGKRPRIGRIRGTNPGLRKVRN